jgi:hypothetical protein
MCGGPGPRPTTEELRDRKKKELFEKALTLAARAHPVDPKALRELREEWEKEFGSLGENRGHCVPQDARARFAT